MRKILLGLLTVGVVYTCDAQWTTISIPSTGKIESIDFVNASRGFAASTTTFFKTYDGGQTWNTSPIMGGFRDIDFVDSLVGYAVGNVGLIQKTVDGGKNWTTKSAPKVNSIQAVSAVSGTTAFMGVSGGFVYKTTNSGTSFTTTSPADASVTINDLRFLTSQSGVAIGSDGIIYRTTNAGTNWDIVWTSPVTAGYNAVSFGSSSRGLVVGSGGVMAVTINSGANWIKRISGTTKNLNAVHFCDANNGMAVGDSGIVLRTANGGDSWQVENIGTGVALYSVYLINPTTAIIGGQNMVYRNANMVSIATSVKEQANHKLQFDIYPNPAVSEIRFSGLQEGAVQYNIIDLTGKIVQSGTLLNTEDAISVSELQAGSYFIEISGSVKHGVAPFFKAD